MIEATCGTTRTGIGGWGSRLCALAAVLVLAAGCASIAVEDYSNEKPAFDLKEFFTGKLVAKGAFYGLTGSLDRRFTASIVGTWEGDKGKLEEEFIWSDGEKQYRTWVLEKVGDNKFRGTAGDVVGEATGRGAGNAFNWNYKLRVKTGEEEGDSIDVRMDDWIHLIDQNTVLNRTDMTWYGLSVGEVVLTIEKVGS